MLTAPNMSGKSTLMRSALVAALLANCGLAVPCSSAIVPRYDNFFLRTASFDIPSEAKVRCYQAGSVVVYFVFVAPSTDVNSRSTNEIF